MDILPPYATDTDGDTILDPILPAGASVCAIVTVEYPASTAAADVQAAQSDRATWRFAFDGVAS